MLSSILQELTIRIDNSASCYDIAIFTEYLCYATEHNVSVWENVNIDNFPIVLLTNHRKAKFVR
jgi:hypothetical protein